MRWPASDLRAEPEHLVTPPVERGGVDPHGPAGRPNVPELTGEGKCSQPEPVHASAHLGLRDQLPGWRLPAVRKDGASDGDVASETRRISTENRKWSLRTTVLVNATGVPSAERSTELSRNTGV